MVGGQHGLQSKWHKARAVPMRKSFIYGKKSPNDQNDGARKIVLFENEKKNCEPEKEHVGREFRGKARGGARKQCGEAD